MQPAIECPVASFQASVAADPAAHPWDRLPAAAFALNATGGSPGQATTIRCARDVSVLRLLFECQDVEPWATITQRDSALWEEEVVEVFIDPVGDAQAYFEIEVNPLNTVLDLVLRRSRSGWRKDFRWDCAGLATAVRHTAQGWNAELAIPFESLAPDIPRAGSVWRVNFARIDRPRGRERELSAWAPTRLSTFLAPERFGALRFV